LDKNKVFIIAEAGVNHNGDLVLAKRLIDAAAYAGVDAVKFQTWQTDLIVTKSAEMAEYQQKNTGIQESQYNMLKKLELSYNDFRELKDYCDKKNIMFMSTADEESSADFLNELQNVHKIGSGELTNIPFLRHIAKFKKRVILSTGMGTLCEVEKAVDILIESGLSRDDIILLHVTTMYPTPMEDVNLNAMLTLKNAFKTKVGYSDHTMGIEVPIAAVALGAKVIEKHFTLDRTMEGPDHKASLEPDELKSMVKSIRNIELALGSGIKKPSKSEKKNIKITRKSIVASRPIRKGEIFSQYNLTVKRAGKGIDASRWDEIVGTVAQKDYKENDLI